MTDKYHIGVKDYDGNEVGDIHIGMLARSMLARSMSTEQFTKLFDDFLNLGGKDFINGKAVGEQLRFTHRTLQRLAISFALGIIVGISDQERTDPRNEQAILTAKKIAEMVENNELLLGMYIQGYTIFGP